MKDSFEYGEKSPVLAGLSERLRADAARGIVHYLGCAPKATRTSKVCTPDEPIYEMIPPPQAESTSPILSLDIALDLTDAPPFLIQWFAYTRNIPQSMRDVKRWCVWQKHDDGRKMPYRVLDGRHWSKAVLCKSDTPEDWVSFDEALFCFLNANGHLGGLSFALGDGWMGFDNDDVIVDGQIHPQTKSWLARLGGYQEPSQSGKGIKNILKGTLDADFLGTAETGRQFKGIPDKDMATEVYHCRRFFFLTGNGSGEPTENQQTIDAICAELMAMKAAMQPTLKSKPKPPPRPRQHSTATTLHLSDTALLEKIRASKQGDKFQQLWNGQTGTYESQSEADMALTTILMWWTNNDTAQVERLFEQSGLAKREKWDRDDYRERTLSKSFTSTGYTPKPITKRQSEALQRLAEHSARRQQNSEVTA